MFLFFFCDFSKLRKLLTNNKKDLIIIAIFGNVIPFNLISYSEMFVDSVVASSLIGTMPLFTFIIALKFFKKKINYLTVCGLITGFMGMIIFINPFDDLNTSKSFFFSSLIILSAIMYAFSANWVKKLNSQSSFELAFCSIAFAAVITVPLLIVFLLISDLNFQSLIFSITLTSFISATILGVVCTGIAISVFFSLIKFRSPVFASQSNYLIPCFGFLWSYIFLNENLKFNLLVGLIFIVAGAYLVHKEE